jgi:hypothetical protein
MHLLPWAFLMFLTYIQCPCPLSHAHTKTRFLFCNDLAYVYKLTDIKYLLVLFLVLWDRRAIVPTDLTSYRSKRGESIHKKRYFHGMIFP